MASVNKVILIGHLGDDPKVDVFQNGAKKVTLSVATTERGYTTKSGAVVQDRTDWHRVVFWEKIAEYCEKALHKGSLVYVEGSIHTSTYDGKDGEKKYSIQIDGKQVQLLDKRAEGTDVSLDADNAPKQAENRQESADGDNFPF